MKKANTLSLFIKNAFINIALIKDDIFKDNLTHYKLQRTKINMKERYKGQIFSKPVYAKLSKQEKDKLKKIVNNLKDENDKLYEFYELLRKHTKEENLRRFMSNIPTLTINKRIKRIITPAFYRNTGIANYKIGTNAITLYLDMKNVQFHELLHMSSSSKKPFTCGFQKIFETSNNTEPEEIGRGLDEGYTEIQNNRIFNHRSFGYIKLQKIAHLIELFFEDDEEMQDYYLNGDLNGLFYELSKYMTNDEIIDILIDADELTEHSYLNYIKYLKLKKKLLELYSRNKSEEEIKKFKKESRTNQLVKILTKKV